MKDQLIFDVTDANTILDSDNVGAYLRMFENGKLVSYSNVTDAAGANFAFVDGDVTVGTDSVAETAHGFETGDIVQLTSTGTLPAGLALATDYWVIRVDANTVKFASSLANAEAGTAVDITAAAGGGTHTATKQERTHNAMDVNIVNDIDMDIRDLDAAQDSIESWTHDGTGNAIGSTAGALDVNIASGSLTISSEYAEDSAHSSGDTGSFSLAVRQDTLASSTSADGDYAAFKVNASGELYTTDEGAEALLTTIDADTSSIAVDTAAMVVDLAAIEAELLDQGTTLDAIAVDAAAIEAELLGQGTTLDSILTDTNAMVVDLAAIEAELLDQGTTLDSILADTASIDTNVASLDSTVTALSKAEDSAHSSGDQGIQALAVRNDTLAALADTDGDYAPLQVDADGALYVNVAAGSISTSDAALADTAIASAANPLSAANTAEDVVASPLASRKYLWIYNNGNRKAYIGASGVSAANGFPVSPGSYLEMRAGAAIDIEWVSDNTSQEIRTLELS